MSRKHTRRRVTNDTRWAEIILSAQQFSEADATEIVNKVRAAYVCLRDGKADDMDFIRLACAINIAGVRAEEIDRQLIDVFDAAGAALTDCQARHERIGRYGLTGPGLLQVDAGLDAYEAIVRASSPRQMQLAEREVVRRMDQRSVSHTTNRATA